MKAAFLNSQVALFSAVILSLPAYAQTASAPAPGPIKADPETMVVLGTATPVPLAESARPVEVLPLKSMQLTAETAIDVLRQDSSIFIEQRGAGGAQADLVLQGGSFAQTLVLVNGFRVNDAQTAHHNLDLPVPMEAMSSIEVLQGAGSTLHGVDALSGVADFITSAPDRNSLRIRLGGGSFQSNEESLLGGATRGKWSGRLTADRNFSTGFMTDRDYRNENAAVENWFGSRFGLTNLLLAGSDRAYGANKFYGNYPSWERTKSWFAGIRQELGQNTNAAFGYRRHTDEFILIRNRPAVYENNHIDSSWQATLRHTLTLQKTSVLLMGLEADGDKINSNNLGVHARNRGAGYLDLDLRPAARRWSFSAGAREEIFSGGGPAAFSPQLAGSLRIAPTIKLRASGGYGFRVPTYTDLYYSDPTTIGNPNLRPEYAWSANAGADWNASSKITANIGGFYSRQHDTIDYVRSSSAQRWQAANLNGLQFAGAEARLTWIPVRSQAIRLAYTGLHGAQGALHGLQSIYVFNYPTHNAQASWAATFPHSIVLTNFVQVAQRFQATPYPVWNATIARATGRLRPYLRLANLSNTGYQEISGVAMPPRTIIGGFVLQLGE